MSVALALVRAAEDVSLPCTDDPDLFFAEEPGPIARAKRLCSLCPIRAICLETALDGRESGVWGGEYLIRGKIRQDRRFRSVPTAGPRLGAAAFHPGAVSLICGNGHRRSVGNTREGEGGRTRCLECERDRSVRSRQNRKAVAA